MVAAYGLNDCVSFEGYSDNIPEALQDYDCGVMCSENEAFGRVTVEYMMAGLVTIATDAGANRELTDDGKYAVLYENGSAKALAEVISKIISGEEERADIYSSVREYALNRYDINKNVVEMVQYFKKME